MRGIYFQPQELIQRINLYNQQHGNKPPPGTVIPKWTPKTPPPIIDKSNKNSNPRDKLNEVANKPSSEGDKKKSLRPFTNTPTKSTAKPNVSFLGVEESKDDDMEEEKVEVIDKPTPIIISKEAHSFECVSSSEYFQRELLQVGMGARYLVSQCFYKGETLPEDIPTEDLKICMQLTLLVHSHEVLANRSC